MKIRMIGIITIVLIIAGVLVYLSVADNIGGTNTGEKLIRLEQSKNFKDGKFHNLVPTAMAAPKFSTMRKFFSNDGDKYPSKPIETLSFNKADFDLIKDTALAFTWFGHSSVLIKIENVTLLIDPVFGKRASLFSFLGPKRFEYTNPHHIDQLPPIDAVLISHDHYDHLEYKSILALKDKVNRFYVPLGVGVHLEKWGVSPDKITELDWWDEVAFSDSLKFVFSPTRHFTGRGLFNRDQSLWGSWSILGQNHKVFFSGDSGYFKMFEEVGEKLGPFDLAFVENGQYNLDWEAIHMMPEQSAKVGAELRASAVVPIHWGKFSLSIHSWYEPIERFTKASENYNYQLLTPQPGQVLKFPFQKTSSWWKD